MPRKFNTQRCDCKLNDEVIDCRPAWRQKSSTPRHGRIIQLKLKNEHGYALDIRIKWNTGETEKLSPFSSYIRILAPANEAIELQKLAKKRNLIVVRNPGCQNWSYFLVTQQFTEVYLEIVEKNRAGLYFENQDGKLKAFESKGGLEDSSTTIIAGKRRLTKEAFKQAEWRHYL